MNDFLNVVKNDIIIILTSMLPVVELRGAIPIGIALGLSPVWATILSVIGSTIPVPFILLFIRPIY